MLSFGFEFSVGIGGFVIGLGQISYFFSVTMLEQARYNSYKMNMAEPDRTSSVQLNIYITEISFTVI